MTHQVALADGTYRRLRARKAAGESFSQAIDRLLDHEPKSPLEFAARVPPLPRPAAELLRQLKAERDATRTAA